MQRFADLLLTVLTMKTLSVDVHKMAGMLLCLLSSVVLAGWLLQNQAMVSIVPGSVAMTINTALLFLSAGVCLLLVLQDGLAGRITAWCSGLLIVLPAIILLEHALDISLGIDLAHVHAALDPMQPRPGRVAPNACLAFLLTGVVLRLRRRASHSKPVQLVLSILTITVLVIGLAGLFGYLLNLETMYQIASFNRMAAATAFGIGMMGFGLWFLTRAVIAREARLLAHEAQRITRLSAEVLAILAIVAGLSGFAILRQGLEQSMSDNMRHMAKNNAFMMSHVLDQAVLLAQSAAGKPALTYSLRNPDQAGQRDALVQANAAANSLLALGLSGLHFLNRDGALVVTAGRMENSQAVMALPLAQADDTALLFWKEQGGFFLRTENRITHDGRTIGKVITEQPLGALTTMLADLRQAGQSNDALLCGRAQQQAICFPSRFSMQPMHLPLSAHAGHPGFPGDLALRGHSGAAVTRDLRGVPVLASHAPLARHHLGLVLKTDIEELHAPVRARLNLLALLLLVFVAVGTFLLYKLVQPLVARIVAGQRRMSDILENSHDAFVAIGSDGRITDWNAQAETTFGWSNAEAVGTDLAMLLIPAAQRQAHYAGFRQFLQSGTGPVLHRRLELQALHRSGKLIPVEMSVAPFVDDQGYAASAFLRDISERKQAELQAARHAEIIEQARKALMQSQKLEAVGKLTGGVAHDFNNVLQVISASLQLLQVQSANPVQADKHLTTAIEAVERGARLSSQLLAFARRQPLQPVVVNLGRMVRGMDDLLQRALGEAIAIKTIVASDLWNTLVDPHQLEHVILNLAINARDAMEGAGHLTIEIGNLALDEEALRTNPEMIAGQYVMLAISDDGAGMTEQVMERAFEPFFTTKPEGQGTGLGLSMAYGFVRQSGGHINIYSEIGYGTTVRLYFPCCHAAELDLPAVMDNAPVSGGNETILVVEDDPKVQATVVDMLHGLGYRVLQANNADKALAILHSGARVDLLFTDVIMPGTLRSTELAQQAKLLLPGIAILFTSGYPQNAIVHGGRLDAGVHLLSKPYRRAQLARKLRDLLGPVHDFESNHADPMAINDNQPGANRTNLSAPSARHILVVEDNQDFRFLVCEMLGILGHQVAGAASAEEALTLLNDQRFDTLLTDITLPGMSGTELARMVTEQYPGIRIIFASGYAPERHQMMPGALVLPKPYDLQQLQDAIA